MKEEEMIFQDVITKLKSKNNLIACKTKAIDLAGFPLLLKVTGLKRSFVWKFEPQLQAVYLVSFYNSYWLKGKSGMGLTYIPQIRAAKYIGIYLEFNFDFSDTIIRPNTIGDKLVNVMLHFNIKLKDRGKFHSLFVLESVDKDRIAQLLKPELLDLVEGAADIHIDIKANKCLIFNLTAVNDTYEYQKMIDIGISLANLNKANL